MNEGKVIIKYLALALACFIIFVIINSILIAFSIVGSVFNFNDNNIVDLYEVKLDNLDNIRNLDIDLAATNFTIKKSDKIKVETNNSNIKVKEKGSVLEIRENDFSIFSFTFGPEKASELILYIPEEYMFNNADIDLGAGKAKIDVLSVDKIHLESGAGSLEIDKISVSSSADLEGGAGKFIINSGIIHNLDFDMGVGKTEINAFLTGRADIEAGVGEVTINLLDSLDNYQIALEKGIGSVRVNGDNVRGDSIIGNGNVPIKVEAGVGALKINTK